MRILSVRRKMCFTWKTNILIAYKERDPDVIRPGHFLPEQENKRFLFLDMDKVMIC